MTANVNAHETFATRRTIGIGNPPHPLGGWVRGASAGDRSRSGLVGVLHVDYFVVVGIVAVILYVPHFVVVSFCQFYCI